MPASIGVNLRVTGHCSQGGRKYMEDFFSVAYQQTEDEKDLEYAFFGIYDGHGGGEAATYAKEHLMESIVRQKSFWSDKDEEVLRAIKEGYIATHYAMWREQANWPKTASGLPSTAGTTATIAFIRHAKIYIGHVGDSGVILGYQEPGETQWKAKPLTKDHKPENATEMYRIQQCGGKVVTKSGVPRVVWNRPRIGHKGPVRRSTPIDEIPFLAVARSLGDLWSYNSACNRFVVSPDPDTCVIPIDTNTFRCLIFGTDGLWNMMTPETAVQIVQTTEKHNECIVFSSNVRQKIWINPSKSLVEHSLERWSTTRMRADNTTAVTLLLDPPGPPRAEVLKNQHKESMEANNSQTYSAESINNDYNTNNETQTYPPNGLAIVTRYPTENYHCRDIETPPEQVNSSPLSHLYSKTNQTPLENENTPSSSELSIVKTPECNSSLKSTKITESQVEQLTASNSSPEQSENIQINEVSSSSPEDEMSSVEKELTENKKRYHKVKLFKANKTNIVFTRRCTRSNDVQQTSSIERRTRTVSSSSDYCKESVAPSLETRKKVKVFRNCQIKDDFRRNTRAMEKNSTERIHFERRVTTRKRGVILNSPPEKKSGIPITILKERFSPPSKKVRQVNCCTAACLSSKKPTTSSAIGNNDFDFSDQENETRQTNVLRNCIENQRRLLRTRHQPDADYNSLSPSNHTCLARNLRERNSNLPTSSSSNMSRVANNNNIGNSKKCFKKRIIPTKNKVQTRNRVKRDTK